MAEMKWDIKVTSKGQITLPKKARDVMMVSEGDYLVAVVKDDSLVLARKPDVKDSEQIRYYARRRLAELGYGEASSRRDLDPPRLRGTLPRLTVDTVRLIREGREVR